MKKVRNIQNSLTINLLHLRELVMLHYRPMFKKYNVTEQQWRILRFLHEFPNSTIESIGSTVAISNASLTGILNRMEKVDWIYRTPSDTDRRCTYINLTDNGMSFFQSALDDCYDCYTELEKNIGTHELRTLESMIQSIRTKAEEQGLTKKESTPSDNT